ncbi:MAG: calcium/sodium antiporter [Planctomycetota bacterium]|jgi:cation:H+ antiporter
MPAAVELLLGWLLLWKGGDYLVDGADRFARGRGMPSSLAGVFILGFGTSAPELVTTGLAASRGLSGIAAGNVVGSNIANVGLILGVAIIAKSVVVDRFLVRVEMPIVLVASVLALLLFLDGEVTLLDGIFLLAAFAAYTSYAVATARRRPSPPPSEARHRPVIELLTALLGLGGLILGAHLFLEGAVEIAQQLGVSETVIGLSLVALGTSLPELATTIAAARSGRVELAVGNVVGSNIFNLLLVLGVAGTIQTQRAEARLVQFDLPVMLGLAFVCWAFAAAKGRLYRWQGVFFLAVYVAYIAILAATA